MTMLLTETLVREHQRALMDAATGSRLCRPTRTTRRHGLRVRAGWWLVHAGIRLALADGSRPAVASLHPAP